MDIVPYRAEHLMAIAAQEGQQHLAKYVSHGHALALEKTQAFTALFDGEPLGCAGAIEHWGGRWEVWSYLSEGLTPKTFIQIHYAAKRFFEVFEGRRLEAYVNCDFDNGHRWIKALGFELEHPRLRKYWPDGQDAALYVRIR